MNKLNLTFIFFVITIFSYAQPDVDFTSDVQEVCVGETIQFTDLSTSSGTISSWTWNFGDGNEVLVQNPTHSYSSDGVYTVTLTAEDGGGANSEVKTGFIVVNPLPNPAFDIDVIAGCSVPGEIGFSNVQPTSNVTYSWDFDNGNTSTDQNPTNQTYNSTGTYDIFLSVTNTNTGCTDDTTQSVEFFDFDTDFNASSLTVCQGDQVNFTDLSSSGADSWNWDFGDGGSSSTQNPLYTFSSPGTYDVTLTSQNSSNGCSSSQTEQVEVLSLPSPTFDFTPSSGCAPLEVDFTNTTVDNAGNFEWDFGNGDSFSGENPGTQTYSSNGTYSVTLTQTDANGCTNSITQTNIISVSSINIDFRADETEGCEDLVVNFTDFSSSPNADDPITSWEWDFGNGNTFSGENPPIQTYSEGIYDVTLTISTDAGCTETLTLNEHINVGVVPNANFSVNPFQDCAKSEWQFDNTSTVPIPFGDSSELSFEWDFGDDGTSSDVYPTYEYPVDTGAFDVQLIFEFRGCPDTLLVEDAVYVDAPIALFNAVDGPLYCNETVPLEVTFNDEAIVGEAGDDAEMIWNWGDGSSETITSPANFYTVESRPITHEYLTLGQYEVEQIVNNSTTGCSDTVTQIIYITEVDANLALSSDSVCFNDPINAFDNGSTSDRTISSFLFSMDNGSTLSGSNINYTYPNPGEYDISLIVTNDVGCKDTATFNDFRVLELPEASIDPSASAGCSPLDVEFSNTSTNPSGVPISSSFWTFDDGSTETTTNLSATTNYTFSGEDIFTTTLAVTDEFGCTSLPTTVTTEITKPDASFDVPQFVCAFEEFTAQNTSSDFSSSEWFLNGSSVSNNTDFSTSFSHQGNQSNLSFTDDISLVVTDANGCKDNSDFTITTSTPHAEFDYVFDGANVNAAGEFVCPPVFADFTDLSNSIGDLVSWDWDFGDGNFSTLENPNNTYVFAGTYTGGLIITDEYGCSDTVMYEDYLTIGGPQAEFEVTEEIDDCQTEYLFTPVSTDGVVDIIWDFGDGTIINEIDSVNYIYSNEGTYFPTATIVGENDCNITYNLDTIEVTSDELNAFFEASPTSLNWDDPIVITDLSSGGFGGIQDWTWDIAGDVFSNNGGTFEYYFDTSGVINIHLTVTDTQGCIDTFSINVTVTRNLSIPNVFTPNGDEINDEFKLRENSFKSYTVVILNRWGNVVSESFVDEGNYLWDGMTKSKKMATEGTYFYKISGVEPGGNERTEHGFVQLVIDNE